jgi:non-ribosomal peptide synthetase component E (peptide arylation enzyme)
MNVYDISNYPDRTIGKALEFQAATNAEALWIWAGERRVSFGEADRLVNRLAHGLQAIGVRKGRDGAGRVRDGEARRCLHGDQHGFPRRIPSRGDP